MKYLSKMEWSKVNAPDSTMKAWDSWKRNQERLYSDHKTYLDGGIKHDEDIEINLAEIGDKKGISQFIHGILWMRKYPPRLDKRRIKNIRTRITRQTAELIKFPVIKLLEFVLGKEFGKNSKELGFKKVLLARFKK